MSERTIITTIEITKVYKELPECFEFDKKAFSEALKEKIKENINIDDVVVTNVQEFVRGEVDG